MIGDVTVAVEDGTEIWSEDTGDEPTYEVVDGCSPVALTIMPPVGPFDGPSDHDSVVRLALTSALTSMLPGWLR